MSRPRLGLATAALVIAAALGASCPDTDGIEGAHSWGVFELCLRRVSDTCREEGKACATPAVDATRRMTVAVRPDAGTLLLSREGLPPLEGVQRGAEIEAVSTGSATLCGCAVTVTERIRATLSPEALGTLACSDSSDGGAGCGPADGGIADGGSAGEDSDGGPDLDLDASYFSLRGSIVDEIEGAGCAACAPCRIEYELTGRR